MTANPSSWMPLYWGDYARDTGHLNALSHGAYLMLIKHYWCTAQPLRNDDDELWRIACCDSRKQWMTIRDKVLRLFVHDNGGILRHRRIDKELNDARAHIRSKVEAGKRGAEKRWHNDSTPIALPLAYPSQDHGTPNGTPTVLLMPNHRFTNAPSPSPSPIGESLEREGGGAEGKFELQPTTSSPPIAAGKPARRKRAKAITSALARDWMPSEDGIEFAHSVLGPSADVGAVLEKFHRWYTAHGVPRANWDSAWEMWVSDEPNRQPKAH